MKNKDLGTVEFLIFLIKPFFSSILLPFVFCSHFWKFFISNFGKKKNYFFPVQHSCCNHHLGLCSSRSK